MVKNTFFTWKIIYFHLDKYILQFGQVAEWIRGVVDGRGADYRSAAHAIKTSFSFWPLPAQSTLAQAKAGRQKKCNSDFNQHQLRQEWSEHERLKHNVVRFIAIN